MICLSLVRFPSDRPTTHMCSGVPGAAGNHVTGTDYERVRVMSSMPAKKRLAVRYREMVSRDSDFELPTSMAADCPFEDPLSTEKRLDNDSLRVGDRYVQVVTTATTSFMVSRNTEEYAVSSTTLVIVEVC